MSSRVFTRFQAGLENPASHGTAVAADTVLLADPMPINPDRKPRRPEDAIGLRTRSLRSTIDEYLVQDTLRFSHGYFQVLPLLFSCGIKGAVTGAEQTTDQDDYLYDFTPKLDDTNAPDSLTLEVGDNTQAYECEYTMFDRITISGQISQDGGDSPVVIEAGFFARQWTAASFTSALALPSTTLMNAKLARIYLDTSWASVGTTEKTNLLRGFEIEILTGLHHKFTGSGDRYFTIHGEGEFAVMAAFTFERGASSDAIWDLMNSQALSVVRLEIAGPQIGTGDPHSLVIDIGGTWEDVIPISSEDRGNNIDTGMLVSQYDPVAKKLFQLSVTTNVASV